MNKIISKVYNFKKHKFSPDEKLWLTQILSFNFEKVEARNLRVSLFDEISPQFNPKLINYIFCRFNRLTLLGLWYVAPDNHLFNKFDLVVNKLRELIRSGFIIDSIDSQYISTKLDIPERDIKIIFSMLSDFGYCNGGSTIQGDNFFCKITFGTETEAFDKILAYKNVDETLESVFNSNIPNETDNLKTIPYSVHKVKKKSSLNQDVWKQISEEFQIKQITFGKKINFVKDAYTKKIIFRDIEEAFMLYKSGSSKAAIILAGGVIEELLRSYLLSKGHSFKKNNFSEYVALCEGNNYLRTGARRLSDSARDYRNLVHLENEAKSKTVPTQSMASGAVSAIFTIVNDF